MEQLTTGWRRMPLADRLLMWCVLPAVIVIRLFGGTRAIWTKNMEQHDLPSPQDEDIADRTPELLEALGGTRDDRVLDALTRLYEERGEQDIEVAVVYGAAHVPAIVHGLDRQTQLPPRSGDWLTVTDD